VLVLGAITTALLIDAGPPARHVIEREAR
jgi:hypothetical protein